MDQDHSHSDVKMALPAFLKILTSSDVPVTKSMEITKKIYNNYNTPAQLAQLTDFKLKSSGVNDKEERKLIIAALRKSGYIQSTKSRKNTSATDSSAPSTSSLVTSEAGASSKKRKRKAELKNVNEFLPDGPLDAASDLEFNEVLDESILESKATVVNRAPLMSAWATVVAERMGFRREEALSIASSYTEMNAISKGVSLGIYRDGKQKGLEAAKGGTQPYVELMGRRTLHTFRAEKSYPSRPLYQINNNRWRALHNGKPTEPSTAFSYISRSFRQTTPFIVGALRLLANSYSPQEINGKAWGLYAQFRPAGERWGERSEVRCDTILALRQQLADTNQQANEGSETEGSKTTNLVQYQADRDEDSVSNGRESKRPKIGMTLEEYEAALDQDHTFDDIDLSAYV